MNKSRKIVIGSTVLASVLLVGGIGAAAWVFRDKPKPVVPPEGPKRVVETLSDDLEVKLDTLNTADRATILLQSATSTNPKNLTLPPGFEEVVKDKKAMTRYLADCLSVDKTAAFKQAVEMNPELVALRLDNADAYGPLPCAVAMYGNVELLSWLVSKFPESAKAGQNEGTSLIHAAIDGASKDAIQWLVANQKQLLSVKNAQGQTALHALIANRRSWAKLDMPDVVRSMVAAAPELVSAKDGSGRTALDLMGNSGTEESAFRSAVRQIIGKTSTINQ